MEHKQQRNLLKNIMYHIIPDLSHFTKRNVNEKQNY